MVECTEPKSMDELLFFTNRTLDSGRIRAWVHRPLCPSCKKATLARPTTKTGKAKKDSEYTCPACKKVFDPATMDASLALCIDFVCPFCKKEGMTTTPYKRKKWQGVDAYVFTCTSCSKPIGITKKMKRPKGKNKMPIDDE